MYRLVYILLKDARKVLVGKPDTLTRIQRFKAAQTNHNHLVWAIEEVGNPIDAEQFLRRLRAQ